MSKDDPLVEFGREVRRRREALGLTLEGLAERSELTPNYIGTIENGKRDPSISTISAIARGLDLAPGELLGEIPELSPMLIEVGRLFDGTSPEIQAAVLSIMRAASKIRRK
jgi:transcriptional regulator with XRE-family HTH domain